MDASIRLCPTCDCERGHVQDMRFCFSKGEPDLGSCGSNHFLNRVSLISTARNLHKSSRDDRNTTQHESSFCVPAKASWGNRTNKFRSQAPKSHCLNRWSRCHPNRASSHLRSPAPGHPRELRDERCRPHCVGTGVPEF